MAASTPGGSVGVGVAGTLVVGAAAPEPLVAAFLVAAVAAAATMATTALEVPSPAGPRRREDTG